MNVEHLTERTSISIMYLSAYLQLQNTGHLAMQAFIKFCPCCRFDVRYCDVLQSSMLIPRLIFVLANIHRPRNQRLRYDFIDTSYTVCSSGTVLSYFLTVPIIVQNIPQGLLERVDRLPCVCMEVLRSHVKVFSFFFFFLTESLHIFDRPFLCHYFHVACQE